jgi:hypothetical protein
MRLLFAICRPFYLAYYILAMTLGTLLPYVALAVLAIVGAAFGIGYWVGK